jgi:hypothetical protein
VLHEHLLGTVDSGADDVDPVCMLAHAQKLRSAQGKQTAPVHDPCATTRYASFIAPWCSEIVLFAAQGRTGIPARAGSQCSAEITKA